MNNMLGTLERPEVLEKADTILEGRALHQHFRQGGEDLHVLRGIDIRIARGDIAAVLGSSGAGKSTLLHLLGGLQRPTEGSVFFQGDDFYALPEAKRARLRNEKIGFVFQFYHLLPELTAVENVVLPAMMRNAHRPLGALTEEAKALLGQLGLGGRLNHRPSTLSGGEQQRVAIARSLINQPEIVLCDEPTGNLDSERGEEILQLILSLNRTRKTTFLIVTHAEEVARIASTVFGIRDGWLEERS